MSRYLNEDGKTVELVSYLVGQHNKPVVIEKLHRILDMQNVILEIGCGSCEVAYEIALKNPGMGVIATDAYAMDVSIPKCSYYRKIAEKWEGGKLWAQQEVLPNLIIARADNNILRFIPDQKVDTILLINPETSVGQDVLHSLADNPTYNKIKSGNMQMIIAPFSRELGVATCGGNEFEHAEDWSKGLGFMMASRFKFEETDRVKWGVNLRKLSPYSKNSTQQNVYLFGSDA